MCVFVRISITIDVESAETERTNQKSDTEDKKN